MSKVIPVREEPVYKRLLFQYIRLLRTYPIVTKSLTSGTVSALSNIAAQKLVVKWNGPVNWRTIAAFAATGVVYTGPVMHYFYRMLERIVPGKDGLSQASKIIFERLFITPPFLLGYFYCLSLFEGKGHKASIEMIKKAYWITLKMNWKVWTIFQYININYVPVQYRVLFASAVAFFWTMYLAIIRSRGN